MQVSVKRFDRSVPLPAYKTSGAAALDCVVREGCTILPGQAILVPLNIAVKPPEGHFVLLVARSSLYKKGLFLANGIGIGDEDFSGTEDEYRAPVYNFSSALVVIEKGERLVQMLILPFDRVEWQEKDMLDEKSRGGFGTTGQ